jgi:hypothetical protein
MCLPWPYHSNGGAVLLRVGVAMEMLLHSNGDLQDSTVAMAIDVRKCRKFLWKASTHSLYLMV